MGLPHSLDRTWLYQVAPRRMHRSDARAVRRTRGKTWRAQDSLPCSSHNASGPALRKLFEQRLRVLQVRRIEPLGEPTVDLGQHSARFVPCLAPAEEDIGSSQRGVRMPSLVKASDS